MAIITYKTVQTGPNSQLGGFQLGFASASYHEPGVNQAPKLATAATATINTNSDGMLRN